ncbi:probable amino acid permease 7 isoform X2 [Andrographis paniculata]|nr:probable amino acid permease 7 isoform X2 [Andrographis paniculata]
MSQLGWIAGPITMLVFSALTLTSALLLCNCYMSPNPIDPLLLPYRRNASYVDAVRAILGKKNAWLCGVVVHINYIKTGIVYTLTSSFSMRAIQMSNCYHTKGHTADCEFETTHYVLLFGFVQVIMSQIPEFRKTSWLSIVAAIMSVVYATIGSALGLAKTIENGEIKGSTGGVPAFSAAEKTWSIAQAIGDIAFASPYSLIFLEIMDTMKSNPPEKVTMKKASLAAATTIGGFNLLCGGLGYAAFGNSTPGNLLTGFGFYDPYWLIDFANACIALHLVGGYQVYTQPLYASVEKCFDMKQMPVGKLNLLRLCYRTAYVGLTTGVAVMFPYFNQVIGVGGAVTFWPVVLYFPVEMYLVQKKIGAWRVEAIVLRMCSLMGLLAMIFAFVGSIKGLLAAKFI